MKLVRASIRGLMGISEADLHLGKINVFFGPNGAGKSTVLEALLLPIFGESPRAPRKKDWGEMIRHPHRNAEIFLQVEDDGAGQPIVLDLSARINPKSVVCSPVRKPDLFDKILLNPLAFFELPPKIKADLVADVRLDPAQVTQGLQTRELNGPVAVKAAEVILTHGLAGAEKILMDYRVQATRAIADPGAAPTFVWQSQAMAEPTDQQFEEARQNVIAWGRCCHETEHLLGQARQTMAEIHRRDQEKVNACSVLNTVNVPDDFPQEAELTLAEKRMGDMRKQYDDLYVEQQNAPIEACPTCNKPYSPSAEAMDDQIKTLLETMRAEEGPLSSLRNEKSQWQARHHEQQLARQKLADIEALPPLELPDEIALGDQLRKHQDSERVARDWLQAIETYRAEKNFWEKRSGDAVSAKAIRADWDKAVQIIRDPSFKSELTSEPFQKVRDRLAATTGYFELAVEVTEELEIRVNNRPWWLLSGSQKLRASILLADAFAFAGGTKILKIDGVDILVGDVQVQLASFLRDIQNDYDTILLALATEQTPAMFEFLEREESQMPEHYAPLAAWFWVSDGNAVFRRNL